MWKCLGANLQQVHGKKWTWRTWNGHRYGQKKKQKIKSSPPNFPITSALRKGVGSRSIDGYENPREGGGFTTDERTRSPLRRDVVCKYEPLRGRP